MASGVLTNGIRIPFRVERIIDRINVLNCIASCTFVSSFKVVSLIISEREREREWMIEELNEFLCKCDRLTLRSHFETLLMEF